MPSKLILVGLVEPKDADHAEAFQDWYVDNHVEDTYNCPKITAGSCYKLVRPFAGTDPAQYLTIYEWEIDDEQEAERILADYQSDPDAWAERLPNNDSMKIVSAGWYRHEKVFP